MIYRMEGNRLILTLEKPMTLAELFTYFSVSKKQRHLCRMNGSIHCAGKIIRNDDHLLQGEVTIDLSQEQIDWVISDTPSQLVYSSPFLLVVHKPAGCIIHGDADDFVPTEMVYENYHATKGPKELYIVKGAGHAKTLAKDKLAYREQIEKFLKKYEK